MVSKKVLCKEIWLCVTNLSPCGFDNKALNYKLKDGPLVNIQSFKNVNQWFTDMLPRSSSIFAGNTSDKKLQPRWLLSIE